MNGIITKEDIDSYMGMSPTPLPQTGGVTYEDIDAYMTNLQAQAPPELEPRYYPEQEQQVFPTELPTETWASVPTGPPEITPEKEEEYRRIGEYITSEYPELAPREYEPLPLLSHEATIGPMRPEEKKFYEKYGRQYGMATAPEPRKEAVGIFKDPEVNYWADKIAPHLPALLTGVAAPVFVGIYETLQQLRNLGVSALEGEKYDPLAYRRFSELISEDTPEWLRVASTIGEEATTMITAGLITGKINVNTYKSNIKKFFEKAEKAGWPRDVIGHLKNRVYKNLDKLKAGTVEEELSRALKIRKGEFPQYYQRLQEAGVTPKGMKIAKPKELAKFKAREFAKEKKFITTPTGVGSEYEMFTITPSAKEPDKWQLTLFAKKTPEYGGEMEAVSDTLHDTEEQARQALREIAGKERAGKIGREEMLFKEVGEEPPFAGGKIPKAEDIHAILKEMEVPTEHWGRFTEEAMTGFDPKKGTLKGFIGFRWGKIKSKLLREEKKFIPPTKRVTVPPEYEKLPEDKGIAVAKLKKPEAGLEIAAEEQRISDIIDRVVGERKRGPKPTLTTEVVKRRILRDYPQDYSEIAKELKISEDTARALYSQGINKLKGNKEVQEMMRRKMKQANLGPIPSEVDIAKAKQIINKYFKSTKGMTKEVDRANDLRLGGMQKEWFGVTNEAKRLRAYLNKNKNPQLQDQIYDALTGEIEIADTGFPTDVKSLLTHMRDRIDRLSEMIILEGGLEKSAKEVFEANIGRYVARAYRLYEQKKWDPSPRARYNWKQYLRKKYPAVFGKFSPEEMNKYIDGSLKKQDFYFRRPSGRDKKIPTGHFIKRKNLPKEFREFAGEIKNPTWLYVHTAVDQSKMAYNAKFLNQLHKEYPELYTKDMTTAMKRGWKEQLPANLGYGKLRGHFVHPELNRFIRQEINPQLASIEKFIFKAVMNPFKFNKTIGSVPTHARNFLGNNMFSLLGRTSYLNPANWRHYYEFLDVYKNRVGKQKKLWEEMIEQGVTETQFWGSEIPYFFNQLMKIDPPNWPEKITEFAVKKPIHFAGKVYNFEDLIYRGAAYLKYKSEGMTAKEAVNEVNLNFPNYRKLPVVADKMRKYVFPFGPFISFRYNVAKIMVNNAIQAGKEMKIPKTRVKGIKRAATTMFVLGIPTIAAKTIHELQGIKDEDIKELTRLMPPHRRRGSMIFFKWGGKLKAFDLTYLWPMGEFERALKAGIKGDIKSATDALNIMAHPVFDAYSIMVRGRDPYWDAKLPVTKDWLKWIKTRGAALLKQIYLPASTPIPNFKALLKGDIRPGNLTGYQLKAIIDAYNQQPDRYGRVKSLPEEVKAFFTGIKTWNVEPEKLLVQNIRAAKFQSYEIIQQLKGWMIRNSKAPDWEIKEQINNAQKDIASIFSELFDINIKLEKGKIVQEKEIRIAVDRVVQKWNDIIKRFD